MVICHLCVDSFFFKFKLFPTIIQIISGCAYILMYLFFVGGRPPRRGKRSVSRPIASSCSCSSPPSRSPSANQRCRTHCAPTTPLCTPCRTSNPGPTTGSRAPKPLWSVSHFCEGRKLRSGQHDFLWSIKWTRTCLDQKDSRLSGWNHSRTVSDAFVEANKDCEINLSTCSQWDSNKETGLVFPTLCFDLFFLLE